MQVLSVTLFSSSLIHETNKTQLYTEKKKFWQAPNRVVTVDACFQKQLLADILQNRWLLKILQKFTEKHLWLQATTILRMKLQHKWFSCDFCKTFKNTYFIEHVRATASPFWRSNNRKQYTVFYVKKLCLHSIHILLSRYVNVHVL